MTTVINGSSPSITFSDSTTQTTAFTSTPSVTTITTSADASISGLTVGKGGGSGSANTALGASALAANTSGTNNTALGYLALTTSNGSGNTGIGRASITGTTSGSNIVAVGDASGYTNTTGTDFVAVGAGALYYNTTGSYNVALGRSALQSNTTASNNTAVGYQAGYTNTAGTGNTFIGYQAGYTSNISGGNGNTCVGGFAGYSLTTGSGNCFVGGNNSNAGYYVTTGSNNTILGGYTGNQGGLDIRTASNYIVLSDGAGNPRQIIDGNNNFLFNTTSAGSTANGFQINNGSYGNSVIVSHNNTSSSGVGYIGFYYSTNQIGSITQSGTTAVLYNTTSDYRLKNDVTPIQNALAIVEALNPVSFTWIDGRKDDGFLAHEIQAVIPNCVTGEKDAVNEDGTPKYQQMDNSGVIPFLVKAIQEQQALIESLTTRLTALEAK